MIMMKIKLIVMMNMKLLVRNLKKILHILQELLHQIKKEIAFWRRSMRMEKINYLIFLVEF